MEKENDTYTISRVSSDSDSDVLTFPEEYQNTWINTSNSNDVVVITATTVTYKNFVYTLEDYNEDYEYYTAYNDYFDLNLSLEDNVLTINQGCNMLTYTLDGVDPDTSDSDDSTESDYIIPSGFRYTTWNNEDKSVSLFFGTNSISVNDIYDSENLTYTDGTLSFTVNGASATVTQSGDNLIYTVDGTSYTLTKEVSND